MASSQFIQPALLERMCSVHMLGMRDTFLSSDEQFIDFVDSKTTSLTINSGNFIAIIAFVKAGKRIGGGGKSFDASCKQNDKKPSNSIHGSNGKRA